MEAGERAVPIKFEPPKYAVVVNALQQRILDGTYPPGSKIPSETDLVEEFGISRPTVVRALGFLQQDGWIDAEHGRGRFVRARLPQAGRQAPAHAAGLLDGDPAMVKLLQVGPVVAPNRIVAALGLNPGAAVIARQRLVASEEVGPVELSTTYLPVDLAAGTLVGESGPLPEGLLEHLSRVKNIEFNHVVQRVSSRLPSAQEAKLLDLSRREPVLTVLLAVFDRAGLARFAVDALLPSSRHELEEAFPIS